MATISDALDDGVTTDDDTSDGLTHIGSDAPPEGADTATGSMSADTAALGGGAIADMPRGNDAGPDIDGGSR